MRYVNKLFLCILLCLVLCFSVFADVLPWPDNDFLHVHEADIDYTTERYVTYSPFGSVAFYEKPNGKEIVFEAENYEIIYPCYKYEAPDGLWLLVETRINGNWTSGWCDFGELLALYNSDVFFEEYADRIGGATAWSAEYAEELLISYAYPCSGIPREEMILDPHSESLPEFQSSFVDADGRTWGYVNYYRGMRNAWVCLSDPYNKEIPFTAMSKTDQYAEEYLIDTLPEITPTQRPESTANQVELATEQSGTALYILIGIIAVVVVAAALCIYLLGKKRHP